MSMLSASLTFLYGDVPIGAAGDRAAMDGFSAVEFQILKKNDAITFAATNEVNGLDVALINVDVGDLTTGGLGISGVPGRKEHFLRALETAYENAKILDTKLVNIGPSRVPANAHRDQCVSQLIENLKRMLDRFSKTDIRLSVEALNAKEFPDILVNCPEMGIDIIKTVGASELVLQYDMDHAAMDGRDISVDLREMITSIGHVQFADCPGRGEPGTGRIDFRREFKQLRTLGYKGYVGAEYRPSRPTGETLAWMEFF